MGGMEEPLAKRPTKGRGEAHTSSPSLTLARPSHVPLRRLTLLGGNCGRDPMSELKARKAEAFISVTLASPALYKGSFSEDQEMSLRKDSPSGRKNSGGRGREPGDRGRKVCDSYEANQKARQTLGS